MHNYYSVQILSGLVQSISRLEKTKEFENLEKSSSADNEDENHWVSKMVEGIRWDNRAEVHEMSRESESSENQNQARIRIKRESESESESESGENRNEMRIFRSCNTHGSPT